MTEVAKQQGDTWIENEICRATEIARTRDAQGFPQNKKSAREGGTVAGNARRELERKSGRKVVTGEYYLSLRQPAKKVQK